LPLPPSLSIITVYLLTHKFLQGKGKLGQHEHLYYTDLLLVIQTFLV
jgi:hypothetical protein